MIAFLIFLLLQAVAPKAAIAGTVIDAGAPYRQPLFHAQVELRPPSGESTEVLTDVNGRFAFPNLVPGRYRVSVIDDGFLRKATTITIVAGQQKEDVVIGLDAAPTLVGRIRDEFNAPISNILVEAMKVVYGPRGDRAVVTAVSALTDDHGVFHLYWLDPGDYYLRASSLPPVAAVKNLALNASYLATYPPYYYPGFRDPKDAAKFRIRVGFRMTAFDFQLQPAPGAALSGLVSIEATGAPVSTTVTASFAGEVASTQRYSGKSSARDGAYSLGGMPPGSYIVSASTTSGGQLMTIARKVTLKLGQGEFLLQLSPGVAASGRISVESGGTVDFKSTHVALDSVDPDLPSSPDVAVDSAGRFTLTKVPLGDFAIRLTGLEGDAYVKTAKSGEADILSKSLRIDWTSPAPIQITLATDGSRLSGVILDKNDRPFADAYVVLVPDSARRIRLDQYRTAISDEDGNYSLRGIPPGDYKIFAWQNVEPNGFMDANYIAGYELLGFPVSIPPSATAMLPVRLIPFD